MVGGYLLCPSPQLTAAARTYAYAFCGPPTSCYAHCLPVVILPWKQVVSPSPLFIIFFLRLNVYNYFPHPILFFAWRHWSSLARLGNFSPTLLGSLIDIILPAICRQASMLPACLDTAGCLCKPMACLYAASLHTVIIIDFVIIFIIPVIIVVHPLLLCSSIFIFVCNYIFFTLINIFPFSLLSVY
jgi:hypothetical protein